MTVHSGGSGNQAGAAMGGGGDGGGHTVTSGGSGGGGGGASSARRLAMIDVPPFADGAVAELHHGPDGTVIAEIRIPGPDPAHRHGGPGAGWYVPGPDGWQRITDAEASEQRYPDMAHFMHDPRTVTGMPVTIPWSHTISSNSPVVVQVSDGPEVTVRKVSYHGEPMVETEPGVWMDPALADGTDEAAP